jgi:hypothetical protein
VGVEDEASRCAMEATDKESTKEMSTSISNPPEAGGVEGVSPGLLVWWQERPPGERVLEEARRVRENCIRIRIRTNRQKKLAAIALRRRIRRSRRSLSLRDETRG